MNRITYELGYKGSGQYDTDNTCDMPANNFIKALNKLGQLEDFEEELGIDLITLFKAMKNGFYYLDSRDNEIYFCYPYLSSYHNLIVDMELILKIKDYGKTWALTKEELGAKE